MADFTYSELVEEETAGRAEREAAIPPGTEAIHDATDVAAHFDAALTTGKEQTTVFQPDVPNQADAERTDGDTKGGPSVWGY